MALKFVILSCFLSLSVAIPAIHIEPRIIGGREASPHEFPFLVSIAVASSNFSNCGGTILSDRWILTAGHCIADHELDEFIIRAGKHDLSKEESGEQVRKPIKFVVHGGFSKWEIGPDDIGLILLDEPLTFSDTVKPIDFLPNYDIIPTGDGIVSGWGSTSLTLDPEFPECLRTATVPILPHDVCANALKEINYTTRHLCSGPLVGKVGHCAGDSGSALVQKDNNGKFTIIGVVSFAYNPCGTDNIPPAFGRVSSYTKWMQRKMKLE